jgi:hypothetical protein
MSGDNQLSPESFSGFIRMLHPQLPGLEKPYKRRPSGLWVAEKTTFLVTRASTDGSCCCETGVLTCGECPSVSLPATLYARMSPNPISGVISGIAHTFTFPDPIPLTFDLSTAWCSPCMLVDADDTVFPFHKSYISFCFECDGGFTFDTNLNGATRDSLVCSPFQSVFRVTSAFLWFASASPDCSFPGLEWHSNADVVITITTI